MNGLYKFFLFTAGSCAVGGILIGGVLTLGLSKGARDDFQNYKLNNPICFNLFKITTTSIGFAFLMSLGFSYYESYVYQKELSKKSL